MLNLFAISETANNIALAVLVPLLALSLRKVSIHNDLSEIGLGLVLGYYLGGFLSGLLHWFMDSYDYDSLKERHFYFRDHHVTPTNMINTPNGVLLTEVAPITLPIAALLLLVQSPLLIVTVATAALFGNLSQLIHKYSHIRKHENDRDSMGRRKYPRVPIIVKLLQDLKIILHPDEHSLHHSTELKNYCIAHSHADRLFEYLVIQSLGCRSSIYMHNNQKVKALSLSERCERVDSISGVDVLRELAFPLLALGVFIGYKYLIPDSATKLN